MTVLATIRNDVNEIIQFCKTHVQESEQAALVTRYHLRFWALGSEGIADVHTVPFLEHEMLKLLEALLTESGLMDKVKQQKEH